MKTREQVEELKRQWAKDPCWDIENTEGFEEHREELDAFAAEEMRKWNQESEAYTPSAALQQAQAAWYNAENYYQQSEMKDGNTYWRSRSDIAKQDAATLAAIAQAEALTRIAEALETMLDDQTHERTQRLRAMAQRNAVHVAAEELGL